MYAELGNANAVEPVKKDDQTDEVELVPLKGQQATRLDFPEGTSLTEALKTTADLWKYHSAPDKKTGLPVRPAWVESDSEGLQALLAEEFGCDSGCPKSWKGARHPDSVAPAE